ncbi:uncharacterized protein LOC112589921 [Harpegnathos saltator]|uniref:uncharacterized protein LOC112589921 n=1 Tax=Harpegnathos saltator TaxID=610380 RepID=UPI000DBED745|nr:uncharacterized protein LOC112589921 [Harpegnathos saltator]XP_025160773.1 uncharacterized protein LOC112589921 [Harpegnathos saltator]XP_025160774.1 uncharacterized protein LOC112589921 [Harpegnathos saltator]XP_025160775.1 uncharacterized protein LOC112589921 [Harpegnathos saltator]
MYEYIVHRRNYAKRWINRRWWVRSINKNRNQQGDFNALFQELKDDTEMFFRYTRMSVDVFYLLLKLVEPFLRKENWRALCPEQRLSLTLRFLATGDQLLSIAFAYRIGASTASSVIKHTCTILNKVLIPLYLTPPTSEKWKEIATGFLKHWNIPNCVGSFDGKHINIQAQPNSGSVYFNYKKTFSIVLMAACDSNYKFTLIDVGANGSISDGSIFASSEIGQAVKNETLNIPRGQIQLPGSNQSTPYFLSVIKLSH